jgi:predicted phosphodiesterase
MSIFITGDTHGDFTRLKTLSFKEGCSLNKYDYVIILGDFSGIWDVNKSGEKEKYWLNWLSSQNWTTLFLDGNHENFDRLNSLKETRLFGGKVGIVKKNKSIFHLKRGEIYTIDNMKFFVMGGAQSVDRHERIENISWWADEMPNYQEYENAIHNLERQDWKVDYILTHSAPYSLVKKLEESGHIVGKIFKNQIQKFFEIVKNKCEFNYWFCGHFHLDQILDKKFILMYNKIIQIRKEKMI